MRTKHSLATKLIAIMTATGVVGLGCTGAEEADPTEDPIEDPGAREVTLETWTNLPDDTGARKLTQLGNETAPLDEVVNAERQFVVDGVESTDPASLRSGSEIVVPLNTGETATLARKGDRLELVSFTGEDDGTGELPRGAIEAVRMMDDGIEVFLSGSDGSDPDTIVRVSGLEDLDPERAALVTSLALDTILVSLEDIEQALPAAVAVALIAGALGVVWMGICGGLTWSCASQCTNAGFAVTCAGLTVTPDPFSITLGGGYSCRCF
jgi:hypothetical protein